MTSAAGELPEVVRIFPLPGVLLLPRGELPLHIFEPRYRAMTAAALLGDRTIAMIQPSTADASANPPVFPIGCVGRITQAKQTEDGRYFITLTGVARFRIREELPLLDGYRRVLADYGPFEGDLVETEDAGVDRPRLVGALGAYLAAKGMGADESAIDRLKDEALINALCMMCPFDPSEKQAMLEAPDLPARSSLLLTLLEMSAAAPAGTPTTRQ